MRLIHTFKYDNTFISSSDKQGGIMFISMRCLDLYFPLILARVI